MDYVPLLFISAKTGQRVDQVLPMALRVQEERLARLTHIQDQRSHPQSTGRAPASIARGTTVEDVLRHTGPLRPADVHDLRQ